MRLVKYRLLKSSLRYHYYIEQKFILFPFLGWWYVSGSVTSVYEDAKMVLDRLNNDGIIDEIINK